jgi:pimeloyl-ACP methyl ester carboxylesterase|eukprot:COSAG06_NODE_2903_length_6116_cov_16.107861_2_plen_225_part_00
MPSIIARGARRARSRRVSRQRGRRAAWVVVPGSGLCRLEPHRMPRAAVNGVELHYSLLGSRASPRLLVLHHGFQAGVETWAVFAQQVHSADLAVLLFDCRGAGRSGGAQDDTTAYTFDQVAADTLALVDHVYQQGAPFHFAGHSLGVLVGLQLLMEHPQRLASVALVAGAPMSGIDVTPEYTEEYHADWHRNRSSDEARAELLAASLGASDSMNAMPLIIAADC